MSYRKHTLRSMSPVARQLARLAGEAGSLERRLKNLVEDIQELELDSAALKNARQLPAELTRQDPLPLFQEDIKQGP